MSRKSRSPYLKRVFIGVLMVMGLGLGFFWKDLKLLPVVLTSFSAKEFCTCYFVNEQSETYCRELVRQYLPLGDLGFSKEEKRVWAQGLGSVAEAALETDPRFGCRLLVD